MTSVLIACRGLRVSNEVLQSKLLFKLFLLEAAPSATNLRMDAMESQGWICRPLVMGLCRSCML